MTSERVLEALRACDELLAGAGYLPVRHPERELRPELLTDSMWRVRVARQALYCAREARTWYRDGALVDPATGKDRRDKAMRWLGFCQGVVLALGLCGLEELKRQSMPADEEYR